MNSIVERLLVGGLSVGEILLCSEIGHTWPCPMILFNSLIQYSMVEYGKWDSQRNAGCWFQIFFMFTPLGEMIQFD